MQEFWDWLVNSGYIAGEANYYTTGHSVTGAKASAGEFAHALQVGWNAIQASGDSAAAQKFWGDLVANNVIQGDPGYYNGLGHTGTGTKANAGEYQHAFNVASQAFASGQVPNSTGGVDIAPGTAQPGEEQAEEGVGGMGSDPETRLTILTSDNMQWFYDSSAGKWFVQYGMPNGTKKLVFEADPDQMDALFGVGFRPTNFASITTKNLLAQQDVIFSGNIAEMEGTGSFENEYEKVISIAKNNGALPSWMENDAKAYDLLFVAETEGKSNDWLMNEFAKLESFKQRFPGIDEIMANGNLSLSQAVTGFLEFEAGVKQAADALGLPAGVTPDVIGGLIDRGWNLQATQNAMQNYKRQQDFAPAMAAFNEILVAQGIPPLTSEQDLFDFMEGNAPSEYYDIYEASSVQEAATQAGLGDIFSAQDAINAALANNYTAESATGAMQQAAQLLLRLRAEIDLGQFGLTQDELIDVSLGLAPSSGRTEAQVFEEVNRATLTAQANLKTRARPFTGFSSTGIPKAQSLGALRQET